MFKSKPQENKELSGFLAKNCKLTGNLEFTGIFRLDCDYTGDILRGERLEIGPTGRMEGNASVETAMIGGLFKGTMKVKRQLLLHKTAVVEGEIFLESNSLETEPGARVEGAIHMPKGEPSLAKSSSSTSPIPAVAAKAK